MDATSRRVGRARARAGAAALSVCLVGLLAFGIASTATDAAAGPWPPWAKDKDAPEPVYPDVTTTVSWLADRLGGRGLVVVDARSRESYLAGHVPSAISIPASSLSDCPDVREALAERGLSGRGRIICYDDGSYSADAARLFWLLEVAGAPCVSILEGGLAAWVGAGCETANEERALGLATWLVEPETGRAATAAYVALNFGEKGHEIIDARGWDAWKGPVAESDLGTARRVGHIPHALPFDFCRFVLPEGGFADAVETRKTLAKSGPRPSTPVDLEDEFIVYDDGATGEGAIGYFVLRRAGVEKVRYFPGGWNEWVSDPGLPVVRIVGAEELQFRLAKGRRWFKSDAPPKSFAVFDVRHRGDYGRAHVPGAVSLNSSFFADSLDVVLERHWPDLDRTRFPIVTYCYGSNCIRSRNCATEAARQGFINVERFYGGLDEWRAIGGKLIRQQ